MKTTTIFLLSLLFLTNALAQKSPLKWGKIPKEDLAMSTYKADPEAEAVVLGELGKVSLDISTGDLYGHQAEDSPGTGIAV